MEEPTKKTVVLVKNLTETKKEYINNVKLILENNHMSTNDKIQNILEKNIWSLNRCTFEKDFFSYRRDQQITGRMWSVIAMS